MEKWFKFCEDKTATISVSRSDNSCDADNMTLIEINIDTRKMKPCVQGKRGNRHWQLATFPPMYHW